MFEKKKIEAATDFIKSSKCVGNKTKYETIDVKKITTNNAGKSRFILLL